MASSLLDSIGNYLETNMDTCMTKLYDSMLLESQNDDSLHELRHHGGGGGGGGRSSGKVRSVTSQQLAVIVY